MRRDLFCAALVFAIVPTSSGAQSLPPGLHPNAQSPRVGDPGVILTEAEAVARLSMDSPRVRALRAGVDVARVDVLAAGRWSNPRINWDRQSVSGVTEHYLTVSQLLPTLEKILAQVYFEISPVTVNLP